jgi:steroid delta-isomerase-like uncharacterized protein
MELIRTYLAALGSGDPDAVVALVTEDFVNDQVAALAEGCVGRAEYRRRLPGFLGAFEGLRYDEVRVIGEAPELAATYRMLATCEGHAVDIRGVMVFEVVDGLIARRTDYWDALTFLHQTGSF